jgi:hypothetical protein
MNAKSHSWWSLAAAGGLLGVVLSVGALSAQTAPEQLATVNLPRAVMANGQPLPAGSYSLRVSTEAVPPVVGQGPNSEKWVEFVQSGQVRGKELASVVAPSDVEAVANSAPPGRGVALVQMLQGAEYIRVWANHEGTQYLIHLAVAPR